MNRLRWILKNVNTWREGISQVLTVGWLGEGVQTIDIKAYLDKSTRVIKSDYLLMLCNIKCYGCSSSSTRIKKDGFV